jgi:hypothetical protein
MLETFHPHQSMIRKSGFSEKIMLRQSGWNRLPLPALVPARPGQIPGVFQLSAEGIHDACFLV